MNNASTGMGTKKKNKKHQLVPNTERKASGCNWEMYKNLFSKSNTEESHAVQNKRLKPKRTHTTLHTVSIIVYLKYYMDMYMYS